MVRENSTKGYSIQVSLSLHWFLSFPLISIYRMASSMRKRIIQDFQSQLYKTCGIRTLVLTAYEGEDNNLKVSLYVIQGCICTSVLLMPSHIGMMCMLFLKMGRASLSFVQIGGVPTFGRNGLNSESSASVQVSELHIYMCGAHMIYTEPVPSPPRRDRKSVV